MNKVPETMENPVDAQILVISEGTLPFFYRTGHTPNVLTTYSFLLGLAAVHGLWRESVAAFSICYPLGYFFDCVDGQFARHYKMVSRFGDLYDHITDVVVNVALLLVILYRRGKYIRPLEAFVFAVLLLLMATQLGCQQAQYSSDKPETLDSMAPLCAKADWILWTRYFGTGTVSLVVLLYVIVLFRRAP